MLFLYKIFFYKNNRISQYYKSFYIYKAFVANKTDLTR